MSVEYTKRFSDIFYLNPIVCYAYLCILDILFADTKLIFMLRSKRNANKKNKLHLMTFIFGEKMYKRYI
ncbi:hypothetical protein PAUR_a0659 [Pseudoalteromonas aurantia 208]|uniref:Uncharacterized protein n=1 Tax=Pseudoalteromonas aurantia 208 TaxID=1314867 RepID=A0ABR9E8K1_9GAMM|nr:hypothetical protein [Pseudoalteromonas aurantia 208]